MCENRVVSGQGHPIRVLYVNGGNMDRGGISAFMMNYYRHMDRQRVQIDFAVHTGPGEMDDEIRESGGRIYCLPEKKLHPVQYGRMLDEIFDSGEYRVVHAHLEMMNGFFLRHAKRCGIPVRISHSHNAGSDPMNPVRRNLHEISRRMIPAVATHLFACSQGAGEYLYGENPFEIIPNAIEIDRFRYNENTREEVRRRIGVGDRFVIGHVGHFVERKNHQFLIRMFSRLIREKEDAVLLLLGDGPLRKSIEEQARQEGVPDKVIFAGDCEDVDRWYQAMDCFVLPSLHEGLPVSAVEAQACGLPCFLSDVEQMPRDVRLTDQLAFLPLDDLEAWVNCLCRPLPRNDRAADELRRKGYDICDSADRLMEFYETVSGSVVRQ